jgi:predicted GNAT family acetyltransferase
MTTSSGEAEVVDRPDENRLVFEEDGEVAELIYRREGNHLVLVHTGVPDALGGRGIGGRLVEAAVEKASAEGLVVEAWCPFARTWLRTHPEVAP